MKWDIFGKKKVELHLSPERQWLYEMALCELIGFKQAIQQLDRNKTMVSNRQIHKEGSASSIVVKELWRFQMHEKPRFCVVSTVTALIGKES
jgi:hypothetical protein